MSPVRKTGKMSDGSVSIMLHSYLVKVSWLRVTVMMLLLHLT